MSCGELLSRHHPQIPSPDFRHSSLEEQGVMEHLPQVWPQTLGMFRVGIFCVHSWSKVPGESLWQPWSTSQSSEHSEILPPWSFLTDFCPLCLRALLTPRILTGFSFLTGCGFQTAAKFQSWELHTEPRLLWLALCLHYHLN